MNTKDMLEKTQTLIEKIYDKASNEIKSVPQKVMPLSQGGEKLKNSLNNQQVKMKYG